MLSIVSGSNHIYYDRYWQEPAATEKAANENVCLFDLSSTACVYVGFPWATYIDLFQKGQTDSKKFQELHSALINISTLIKEKNTRYSHKIVTCCQHIHAHKYMHFFKQILITDLFWSHKQKGVNTVDGIRLFPFPLYPVNENSGANNFRLDTDNNKAVGLFADERTIICSFVGATDLPGYISDVRSRLSNQFAQKKGAYVKCRSQWHYQGEVYDKQIHGKVSQDAKMRGSEKEDEFKLIMSKSLFSLCPSGTGPNTIRLWESIDFLAIPVILSNRWSPPGNILLWEKACIFFDEHGDLEDLWDMLILYSKDIGFLKEKWDRLQDLRSLYNQRMLSHDLIKLLLNPCVNQLNNRAYNDVEAQYMLQPSDEDRYIPFQGIANLSNTANVKFRFDHDKLHRTPFGYSQLSPYINLYFGPDRAIASPASHRGEGPIVYITGMLKENQYNSALANPGSIVWHVSEEPLWDLLFNSKPELVLESHKNNVNALYSGYLSGLFDNLEIPYFLLTSSKYIQQYIARFSRILKDYDEQAILSHWKAANLRFLAFCEYRKDPQWCSSSDTGCSALPRLLCAYRTLVCEELKKRGHSVSVHGKGWQSNLDYSRQQLPDWHVNKMAHERQSMLTLAIENVAHKSYITEKSFDALAMASMPVVFWASNSEGFNFIESEAVLNLHGMSVEQAVHEILDFKPSLKNAKAFLSSCRSLELIFSSSRNLSQARRKIARRLRDDFQARIIAPTRPPHSMTADSMGSLHR